MVTFLFLANDLGKETKQIDNQTTLKTLQLIHIRRVKQKKAKKWTWPIEDNLITYKPENKQEVAYHAFIYCEFSKPVTREHIFLGIVFRVLYYNFV